MLKITINNTVVVTSHDITIIDLEDHTTDIPNLVRTYGRSFRQYLLSRLNQFCKYDNDSILFMDNIVHDKALVYLRDYFGIAPNTPLCFSASIEYDGCGAGLNFCFARIR